MLVSNLNHIDGRSRPKSTVAQELVAHGGAVSRNGRVVAFFNMKGGVGKTVLAANAAAAAALKSSASNILLVDLDPQFNLSQVFFNDLMIADWQKNGNSMRDLFEGSGNDEKAGLEFVKSLAGPGGLSGFTGRADILIGHDALFDFSIDQRTQRDRERARTSLLRAIARARRDYDVIILDMNPSVSFATLCALDLADHFIAPVRPERFAVSGLTILRHIVEKVRERPPEPEEFSIVVNEAAQRGAEKAQALRDATIGMIREHWFFGTTLIDGFVPFSAALQSPLVDVPFTRPLVEATAFGRPTGATNLRKIVTECTMHALRRAGATASWDLT